MTALKVSRVQKRGQVTIPADVRQRLGLEEGDLVAFIETAIGYVISPQEVVSAEALEKMESYFQQRGLALGDLFAFAEHLENDDFEEPVDVPDGTNVIQQTAGVFARRDRRQPIDFKAVRRQFIEETADNVRAESANNQD